MAPADPRSDEALLLAVTAGDPAAAETFRTRHAATLARICATASPDARWQEDTLRDLASADLAALFAGFDGRSTWRTFVDKAIVDRFLFPRLLGRLHRDPAAHAGEFGAFFKREIAQAVRSSVQGRELREDATQWIWEQLLDEDARQLRTFARDARTPGFVIVKLKRLAQDFVNSRAAPAEGRKRALPDALAGRPVFEQDVFKQFFWWRAASAGIALLALRQRYPDATETAVRDARARVEAVLTAQGGSLVIDRQPTGLTKKNQDGVETEIEIPSPDQPAPFDEVEQAAFRRAVFAAAGGLSNREKLCLLKRLEGKAAGEIARDLGIPNPEAYDLMRKVVDKLRKALSAHPAARERIATVTGNDAYVDLKRAVDPAPARTKGADR